MVDFCKEPEKECQKDPIGELDLKIEQYYSSIYSKLFTHINDTSVHVTQEEKDAWNEKASKDALKDLQDQLNKLVGNEDSSIKNQLSEELRQYINTIISSLDVNSFAKKEDITGLVSYTDLADYAQKDWCNGTFVKIGNSSSSSLDNYYTKSDVDKLINDYSIKKFAFRDNALTIVQNGANNEDKTFIAEIQVEDNGVSQEYLTTKLSGYLKKDGIHNIILNGHTLNLVSEDIIINTSGSGSTSGQDGATYTPYFQNNNSWTNPPALPDDYKSPEMSTTAEGRKWTTEATTAASGEYTWITYVTIDANGVFGKWLNPVCLTGHSGGDQQGLVGSPLRNKGEWNNSTTYYDGYTTQVGDAFWQDFVSHTVNGISNYYICTKQNSGKEPGASGSDSYWSLLSYTDDMFVNNLVAKKANIGELSANEIIISDDSNTVKAGMTSGKSTNVSGQGDVRIWAGSNGNGNIAEAPFTVTESGVLKASNAVIGGEINATSGSVGNMTISGTLQSKDGTVKITEKSITVSGDTSDWEGAFVKLNVDSSTSFSSFYAASQNPVVSITNDGPLTQAGGSTGPCLKLSTRLNDTASLILGGYISGFSRGVTHISNGDKISGQKINDSTGTHGSCYVYSGTASDAAIYLDADTYDGDELIIMNEGSYSIQIKIKNSTAVLTYHMWAHGHEGLISEYPLTKGGVVHAIYTGDYWHLW